MAKSLVIAALFFSLAAAGCAGRNTERAGVTESETSANLSGEKARSIAEIQETFDRYRGEITSIYNRALKGNLRLQGKVVFQIQIVRDGSVAKCRITSSELDSPGLEAELLALISKMKFGASKSEAPFSFTYPIEFLPS